ncbi:hypothetical protein DIPPA_24179 [Diplonema papillatum]|nr:hypothetical protein DIPPA_24179 [Diplonema papillatum]
MDEILRSTLAAGRKKAKAAQPGTPAFRGHSRVAVRKRMVFRSPPVEPAAAAAAPKEKKRQPPAGKAAKRTPKAGRVRKPAGTRPTEFGFCAVPPAHHRDSRALASTLATLRTTRKINVASVLVVYAS